MYCFLLTHKDNVYIIPYIIPMGPLTGAASQSRLRVPFVHRIKKLARAHKHKMMSRLHIRIL